VVKRDFICPHSKEILLFPIPNPPGGQSSPDLSAGSSLARQVLGLDSRNNGGWLLGCICQRRKWGVLVVVFQCCSLFSELPPSGFPLDFGAWHAVLCPLADNSLVAPHSTLTLMYRCGYPARFHLGSPWRLFCGVPTASPPHPWLVPYLDGTLSRNRHSWLLYVSCVPLCPLTQVVSI